MGQILDRLQVYGYAPQEELVILGSLLTGEPVLLIGGIGSSKTTLVRKIGKTLKVPTGIFNTANGQFEDIIGFINPKELGQGKVSYVETPVTIWGKQLVLLDEINRPNPAVANKWLDFLADREMLGADTGNIWRFGAMNPLNTQGTSRMGEATIGRFGSFVYVPEFLGMSSTDRLAVIQTMTSQNMPGLRVWAPDESTVDSVDYTAAQSVVHTILGKGAQYFRTLEKNCGGLDRFLDKFVITLNQRLGQKPEAKKDDEDEQPQDEEEKLSLDGRRVGLLRRMLLGVRAVELAMADVTGSPVRPLAATVQAAIPFGLPLGVNSETGRSPDLVKVVESVTQSLLPFLTEDGDLSKLELHFELLTTPNIFRKLEILLSDPNLDQMVRSAAWTQITKTATFGGAVVGLVALTVESQVPGTIPSNALDGLTKLLDGAPLEPRVMYLKGPYMLSFAHDIEKVLDQDTTLGKIIAAGKVNEFVDQHQWRQDINAADVNRLTSEVDALVKSASNLTPVVERILSVRTAHGSQAAAAPRRRAAATATP